MQNTATLTLQEKELIEHAQKHIKKVYKPDVTSMAALLLTSKGTIYTGINVKYKPIWKCICAERVAIAKAIEAGESELSFMVTVKYFPENDSYEVINMCGECRQVAVFYKSLKVLSDDKGIIRSVPVNEILPFPYM